MIISISLALMIAGTLLVILNNTEIPEIPIYIASGLVLSLVASLAQSRGLVSHTFIEAEIMREIALLGLSILVFYSTSGMLIDPKRSTAVDTFKTSLWLSIISFAGITGVSLYLGFNNLDAMIFGVAGSVGSTLLDSGLVKEESRKNHIYGWLTEDISFYDDLFGIIVLTLIMSSSNGFNHFRALVISFVLILTVLLVRKGFSDLVMKVTGGENELVLLSGITTLIALVWVSEHAGISTLAGVYAAGLILVNTELGFRVRERFSAIKDFFTALSFVSVGYLLTVPGARYLAASAGLVLFASVLRPLFSTQMLRLQGYDLRTSFLGSIQSAQISELVVIAAILVSSYARAPLFEAVAIAFAATAVISHLVEDREKLIFDKLFSGYELDSEKTNIPKELEGHVILAGYDWKTKGLEDMVDRDVLVADYSLERIEDAESENLPHILADLHSDETWEQVKADEASVIVSAIDEKSIIDKIKALDVDAEKILVEPGSKEVREQLRTILKEVLKKKESK